MRRGIVTALAVLLSSPALAAHSISNEFTAGFAQSSLLNPRGGFYSNRLKAFIELSSSFALRLAAGAVYDEAPRAEGRAFPSSSATLLTFGAGLEWSPSEALTLGFELAGSPESRQDLDTALFAEARSGRQYEGEALFRSRTRMLGLLAYGDYGFNLGSDWETGLSLSVEATSLEVHQELLALRTAEGNFSADQLRALCARPRLVDGFLCRVLRRPLAGESDSTVQYQLTAAIQQMLFFDSYASLAAAYNVYSEDPTQSGYYTAQVSRVRISYGAGMPIAPLLFSLRPEAGHDFGAVTLAVFYQYSQYIEDLGFTHGVGARASWRMNRHWRLWATASGQTDQGIAGEGGSVLSSTLSLGARFRF